MDHGLDHNCAVVRASCSHGGRREEKWRMKTPQSVRRMQHTASWIINGLQTGDIGPSVAGAECDAIFVIRRILYLGIE